MLRNEEDALVSFNKVLAEKRWESLSVFSKEYLLGFFLPAILPRLFGVLAMSGGAAATLYYWHIDIFRGPLILGILGLGGMTLLLSHIQRKLAISKEQFLFEWAKERERKIPELEYYREAVGHFQGLVSKHFDQGAAPVQQVIVELASTLVALEQCRKEASDDKRMHPETKTLLVNLIGDNLERVKKEKESLDAQMKKVIDLKASIVAEIAAISTLDQMRQALGKVSPLTKEDRASFQKMRLSLIRTREVLAEIRETGILNAKS